MIKWPPSESKKDPYQDWMSLNHEYTIIKAIFNDKKRESKQSLKKKISIHRNILLLGWAFGLVTSVILLSKNDTTTLKAVDYLYILICGIGGLGLSYRLVTPMLLSNLKQTRYPVWWSFCIGVLAGILGGLIFLILTHPFGFLGEIPKIFDPIWMATPIIITGGISTGKAPLLNYLDIQLGFRVSHCKYDTSPFLELFWKDMPRYAFLHEMWVLAQSENEEIMAINSVDTPIVFLNGSWREDVWCFARALYHYKGSKLDPREWLLMKLHGDCLVQLYPPPTMIVYLSGNPVTLLNRIRRYGQLYEREANFEYLDTLLAYTGELVANLPRKTRILRLNVDEMNFYESNDALIEAANQITWTLRYLDIHI